LLQYKILIGVTPIALRDLSKKHFRKSLQIPSLIKIRLHVCPRASLHRLQCIQRLADLLHLPDECLQRSVRCGSQPTNCRCNGTAERDAALVMMERLPGTPPLTVGGDKGFDTFGFVEECRNLRVTPHVAQNLGRRGGSAIDGRTTRHSGYATSQKKRKRIEECFGWLKTIALMRKVRHRGVSKVHWIFTLACAAYNLVRMRNLAAAVPVA
jgi:hypothetical protein